MTADNRNLFEIPPWGLIIALLISLPILVLSIYNTWVVALRSGDADVPDQQVCGEALAHAESAFDQLSELSELEATRQRAIDTDASVTISVATSAIEAGQRQLINNIADFDAAATDCRRELAKP